MSRLWALISLVSLEGPHWTLPMWLIIVVVVAVLMRMIVKLNEFCIFNSTQSHANLATNCENTQAGSQAGGLLMMMAKKCYEISASIEVNGIMC